MSQLENVVKELRKKNSNWESYYKELMNYFTKNATQDEFFYKFNELLNELQKKTNKKIFDIDYIYKNIFGYGTSFNNIILTKKSTLDKNKTVMDMKNIIYYLDNLNEYHISWDNKYSQRADYDSTIIMSRYILEAKNIKNRDKIILNEFCSASKIYDFFMSLDECVKKNLITVEEQKRTEKLIKKVVKENINKIKEYTEKCVKKSYIIDNKYRYFNFIFDFKNNEIERTLFLMIIKSEQSKYQKYRLIKNILKEGYRINSYDIRYLIKNNINLLSKIYMKNSKYMDVVEYIKNENMTNFLNLDDNSVKYKNVEDFKTDMENIYLQQTMYRNRNNNEVVKIRRKL